MKVKTYNQLFENSNNSDNSIYALGIRALLEKNGIDFDYTQTEGTLLFQLIINDVKYNNNKNINLIKELLDNGADINDGGFVDGWDFNPDPRYRPISNACFYNNDDLFDILMEYSPDLNLKDFCGETPLETATSGRLERIIHGNHNKINMRIVIELISNGAKMFTKGFDIKDSLTESQLKEIIDKYPKEYDTYLMERNLNNFGI